ncbi:MAG: anti-sigma factor antagonist [Clostridiales bacterium]|nr:anti-sigma factor antagonist [Clostridiales bacterium]
MAVKIEIGDNIINARLIGDIDHHTAKGMREEIDNAVERTQIKKLVLDFKNVSFMDSSGIGLVMGRYKIMEEVGGVVKVTNPSNHIKKVMRLAGLDRLAQIENSTSGGNDDEN